MTVNAWSIGHHRIYDKTKTIEDQWQWLIELNDTGNHECVVLTPRRLAQILADVITNEPRALDEIELRSLAVTLGMAIEEQSPTEGF